jgi:hypothetical protein
MGYWFLNDNENASHELEIIIENQIYLKRIQFNRKLTRLLIEQFTFTILSQFRLQILPMDIGIALYDEIM